jgi:hypothetical protein
VLPSRQRQVLDFLPLVEAALRLDASWVPAALELRFVRCLTVGTGGGMCNMGTAAGQKAPQEYPISTRCDLGRVEPTFPVGTGRWEKKHECCRESSGAIGIHDRGEVGSRDGRTVTPTR